MQKINNPFNIRYSKFNAWQGQIRSYHGFVVFESLDYGLRAGIILLNNYIKNGYNSVSAIISRFAPVTENDTKAYIDFVEKALLANNYEINNIEPFSLTFYKLCCIICYYESHMYICPSRLVNIVSKFSLKKN